MFQAYFEVFYLLLLLLVTIEDPSQSAHGYQLLPLAISYLVGNNREFDVSDIFWGVSFIVGREELMTIEDP